MVRVRYSPDGTRSKDKNGSFIGSTSSSCIRARNVVNLTFIPVWHGKSINESLYCWSSFMMTSSFRCQRGKRWVGTLVRNRKPRAHNPPPTVGYVTGLPVTGCCNLPGPSHPFSSPNSFFSVWLISSWAGFLSLCSRGYRPLTIALRSLSPANSVALSPCRPIALLGLLA